MVERAGVCEHLTARGRALPEVRHRGAVHPAQPAAGGRQAGRHRAGGAARVGGRHHRGDPAGAAAARGGHLRPGAGAVALLGRPPVLRRLLPAVGGPLRTMPRRDATGRRPGVRRPGRRPAGPHHDVHGRRARAAEPGAPRRRTAAAAPGAQAARRQRRLPADHRLAASRRAGARRRRAGPGADRGAPGRHPAGAAQLVDPVPGGGVGDRGALARARAGQAARSHGTADPPVRARGGLPAAAGRRAARHGRGLPGSPRLGRPGVRPGHARWSSAGRCCSPSWSPWRAGSSRPRWRRGRCSGGRCPSCCAGCRRGAPGARPGWSTAWWWCSPPRASCSW